MSETGHNVVYSVWTVTFVMAIIGCILYGVALTKQVDPNNAKDIKDAGDMVSAGASLIVIAFLVGLGLWVSMMISQKHARKSIHIFGFTGFVLTCVIPVLLLSKMK